MNTMTDTLTAAQALQDAGVEESQAKAHVQVMAQIVRETQGDLATKADIVRLEAEISGLKSAMQTMQWTVGIGFIILGLMVALL